jgi:hypothetical protein
MKFQFREGEKRTCPYCGQASTFSYHTLNDTEQAGPGAKASPETQPGWTCENKKCSHRRDFTV